MTKITIPKNGSTWLYDAAIDTDNFLEAIASADLTDQLTDEERDRWDQEIELSTVTRLAESIGIDTREERIAHATQFNVYNDENDFSEVFQVSVWTVGDDCGGEWYHADTIWIVAPHLGGDPRGNYGALRAYHVESAAECGALDWVLGWEVETFEDGEWTRDDAVSERCAVGYTSCPSAELRDQTGTEEGVWHDGSFYFHGKRTRATPYSYAGRY